MLSIDSRTTSKLRQPSRAFNRWMTVTVLLSLLLSSFSAQPSINDAEPRSPFSRVAPALLAFAQRYPDELVSIIVQGTHADRRLTPLIQQLQGQVTSDLNIISAVAAQVPGRALRTLADSPDVKWISLDSPMLKSDSKNGEITLSEDFDGIVYQDQFNMGQWSNCSAPQVLESWLKEKVAYGLSKK